MITIDEINGISRVKIEHRKWQETVNQIYAHLVTLSNGELVCLTGPSRAGKSELINEMMHLFEGQNDFNETGLMPVVYVDAENCSTRGSFSTKAFTLKLLDAVKHPFYSHNNEHKNSKSEGDYRRALEKTMKARKVKYLIIDEAQHVKFAGSNPEWAEAIMNSWKCLARNTNVILVIVGAYEILEIICTSSHMVGRKYQVNLGRYLENESDIIEFKAIVDKYGALLNKEALLSENLELLYKVSFGCVGLLRRFLMDACNFAYSINSDLTKAILIDKFPSDMDLNSLYEDIIQGERLLLSSIDSRTNPRQSTSDRKKNTKKPSSKPFQRKAKRIKLDVRTESGGE